MLSTQTGNTFQNVDYSIRSFMIGFGVFGTHSNTDFDTATVNTKL